jgi:hypothetical protein
MTLPNGEHTLEIRDPKGALVGFVVPEKHFRELLGERAAVDALRNQVEQLEKQLTEVGRQRDEARNALSDFEKMFQAWNAYGVVPPRETEIERARESGIRGRELVAEIEKLLYPGADEDRP